jgi:hypothetical protein
MQGHQEEFITRHMDLIPKEAYAKKIVIVGAGAIGSFTALSLAKMGYKNITVYDFDTVETVNIGSQFFDVASIGKKKVSALIDMVWNFTGIVITGHDRAVTKDDHLSCDILIAAVDNMAVRKMLYETSDYHWFIDPRMGAEFATLNVVRGAGDRREHDSYTKSLYSDDEAVSERCTAKATVYTVLLIAGQVVKAVKDVTCGKDKERIASMDWSIRDNAMIAYNEERKRI